MASRPAQSVANKPGRQQSCCRIVHGTLGRMAEGVLHDEFRVPAEAVQRLDLPPHKASESGQRVGL